MKKILLIIIILLLGGCYDYSEIDDISIITGMIIDYKNNMYEITSEVLENEKESKVIIYKTTCINIDSCIQKISKESNKELFISHLKALILTDRTINKDIKFYDYFLRNSKSKMNYYVYYISDKYKDRLFNDKENTSLELKDIIDFNSKNYSSLIKLSFIDMIQKNIEYGIDNIYPNIIITDNKILINSLISFNDKSKIELNNNDSIIYNILSNNINTSLITIPCDNNYFSLIINQSKTKYIIDNDLKINIKINAKLSNYNCKYELNDKDTTTILEKLANEYLISQSNNLINISKKNKIDYLGLERLYYKHSKQKVNLSKINVKVNSKLKITSIGESR